MIQFWSIVFVHDASYIIVVPSFIINNISSFHNSGVRKLVEQGDGNKVYSICVGWEWFGSSCVIHIVFS